MPASKEEEEAYQAQLEWIRFREDALGEYAFPEGAQEKMSRKIRENPFVPLGALMTTGALGYGLWCFRQGRSQHSQYMMRARIAAQGLTVVALLGGFLFSAGKSKGGAPPTVNTQGAK